MSREPCVSALLLERYILGDVSSEEQTAVDRALSGTSGTDTGLPAQIAALRHSDADIRRRYGMAQILPVITRRVGERRQRRFRWVLGSGLGAAAALLLIIFPLWYTQEPRDRIKGAALDTELTAYLQTDTGSTMDLLDRSVLRAGNTIQLAYSAAGPERYGVIFSIDGRGAVTMHYPYILGQSTRLVSGKHIPLEEAYTLDDAPLYEMFFFVSANTPLDSEVIQNMAQGLAQTPPPDLRGAEKDFAAGVFGAYEVKTLTLLKE